MNRFSALDRPQILNRLSRETFDLVVVGGGIVGAAAAWDAAQRGLRVALVEKADFANGASSKSSKLLHGGLRYLEMGDIRLVYESLAQRNRLFLDAAHVAKPLDFLLPILSGGVDRGWLMRAGLTLYDLLSHVTYLRGPWHRRLSATEAQTAEPALKNPRLTEVYRYLDGLTEDARLVIETLKSAVAEGAVCLNYVALSGFCKDESGQVNGIEVRDTWPGGQESLTVRAHQVLLAVGPWLDTALKLDDPRCEPRLRPTKGVHLLIPAQLSRHAVLMRSVDPAERKKRLLFAIPWEGCTLLGTTDTDPVTPTDERYLDDDCDATPAEVAYILAATNATFGSHLTANDVIASFAGWRPLIAPSRQGLSASAVSREHEVIETSSGLLAIAGGKLTSFRTMARQSIDRVFAKRPTPSLTWMPSRIESQAISGSDLGAHSLDAWVDQAAADPPPGLDPSAVRCLARRYGSNWPALRALVLETPSLAKPLSGLPDSHPHWCVEVAYAVRHECAARPEDFLQRRTRLFLTDPAQGLGAVEEVAGLMGEMLGDRLGWPPAERLSWVSQASGRYVEMVTQSRQRRRGEGPNG
ncbi:MAG: glycerol-3-phosphate dehydrogenase/oxidase [Candidatus Sericytochromatia bacterium]|nr:glycerol-3-phosphate dehydrogenase/oxidase [Candidatus Sericytochromatia bacterium]